MPAQDYERMQAAMRNPHLPPAHQPQFSSSRSDPPYVPPRSSPSPAQQRAPAAAKNGNGAPAQFPPKERVRGGQSTSVLVAKVLTNSDASHGRVILPRVAVEANLSFVRQYRTFALQVCPPGPPAAPRLQQQFTFGYHRGNSHACCAVPVHVYAYRLLVSRRSAAHKALF